MERRDFCLEFLEGKCLNNPKCKFAHIIVKDKEKFLKSQKYFVKNQSVQEQDFKLYEPPVGNRKWITNCRDCSSIHHFDYHIRKGTIESMYCKLCINKYTDDFKEEEEFM